MHLLPNRCCTRATSLSHLLGVLGGVDGSDGGFERWPDVPDGLPMLTSIKNNGFLLRSGITVPFFNSNQQPQVSPHALNMRHQTVAITRYIHNILKSGNVQDCRGGAASILSGEVLAIGWLWLPDKGHPDRQGTLPRE
jgi:hypothetical protein